MISLARHQKGHLTRQRNDNKKLTPEHVKRLSKLRVPPAWTGVEFARNLTDDIQAIGYDSKGRKQYLYNPTWVCRHKDSKFRRIRGFNFERLHTRLKRKYYSTEDNKTRVVCLALCVLFETFMRTGNEKYTEQNETYGLITLKKTHLTFPKSSVAVIQFIGKKGIKQRYECKGFTANGLKTLYNARRTRNVGRRIFFYESEGVHFRVRATDLNTFLEGFTKESTITCKDIRTYGANFTFILFLKTRSKPKTEREKASVIKEALAHTALKLGNTPAVCKESYVDPLHIERYLKQKTT